MEMEIRPGDLVQSFVGGLVLRRRPLDTLGLTGVIHADDVCLVLAVINPDSPAREGQYSALLMPLGRVELGWVWATHLMPVYDEGGPLTEEERCKDPLLRDRLVP